MDQDRRDALAQWAFDTRSILGRFHLWLEDVETEYTKNPPPRPTEMSFVNGNLERMLAMTQAVTALGTQLFGRFGDGRNLDKSALNQVKKDADAISAYAMSEGLWYLTRHLPENHAIMVCLGEGLMPKAGETPEMGANPQLGFGRVYARPEVARFLDDRVARLLNDPNYGHENFRHDLQRRGVTVWGAAIDTLENTSRFALGKDTGPMTVLHLFNQPLQVTRPYEGYTGTLVLPKKVVDTAAEQSLLIDFRTPRKLVLQAIQQAYSVPPENVHVWTLGGKSRLKRLRTLWQTWTELGVHLVEDGWTLPTGLAAFTDSGTYAPTYLVGFRDGHVFIVDGYAASAEALQAASLAPVLDLDVSLAILTSKFDLPIEDELHHPDRLKDAREAGIPTNKAILKAEDFFAEKQWDVLALIGAMGPDPYSGIPGVQQLSKDTYRVTVRLASPAADKRVHLTLRFMNGKDGSRSTFQPLLNRFLGGEDYQSRAVKISDSGRIRNELQTLCAEALEYLGKDRLRVHFDRIPPTLIEKPQQLRNILEFYLQRHPIWFHWLELQ
ncbi:hypothetical protein IV102_28710 [bacterium]|nr:hypothetical protein [bacterium]